MTKKVILFLVDGMRADAIEKTTSPYLHNVIKNGLHTLTAKTITPSITLPCHTSLFFSVPPARHGITTNTWTPVARPIPGLFDVLHRNNLHTASFYNWEQLRDLSSPGSLDMSLFMANSHDPIGEGDLEIADQAICWLMSHPFNFVFIYLGQADEVGHVEGWMSRPYLDSIHFADLAIGKVMESLPNDVTYFIAADHGGHERNHGTNEYHDMTIPILCQGPGIQTGNFPWNNVSIMDIAPTILSIFGIQKPWEWEGKNLLAFMTTEK